MGKIQLKKRQQTIESSDDDSSSEEELTNRIRKRRQTNPPKKRKVYVSHSGSSEDDVSIEDDNDSSASECEEVDVEEDAENTEMEEALREKVIKGRQKGMDWIIRNMEKRIKSGQFEHQAKVYIKEMGMEQKRSTKATKNKKATPASHAKPSQPTPLQTQLKSLQHKFNSLKQELDHLLFNSELENQIQK